MSFILDALKKSENERARQAGPALIEARIAPRRRGVPVWAVAIGLILIANLALLAWVLLKPAAAPPVAPPGAAVPAPVAPTPAPPPVSTPPAPATDSARLLPPLPPPTLAPEIDPPAAGAVTRVNPADFQPAAPASRAATEPADTSADASLPSAADLVAIGVPELRLALHVYDRTPAARYVLMNGQRLREGDSAADGVRVERITPEGVVLSWRGRQFRLLPGG